MKKIKFFRPDIKAKLAYVQEAKLASYEWRAESWRDMEMHDGEQWSAESYEQAVAAGLEPITVNKTFPVCCLVLGLHASNEQSIVAKARTQLDSEISQTMTEGIAFVLDQNSGRRKIAQAFKDQIVPGIGFLHITDQPDPRKERVAINYWDWKSTWWDPFASPWLEADSCRYVFRNPWVDLDDLKAVFWKKANEIEDTFGELTGMSSSDYVDVQYEDQADYVEQLKRGAYGSDWADANRRRVRPVEMYYPVYERCWFAVHPDGRTTELKDDMDPREQYQAIEHSSEVLPAVIKKMYISTFLGTLELQDMPTPYAHDEYPIVPFVGYTDRFGFPFGMPRQIRGQNEEVNKRRTMLLAMLKARRVTMEEGVAGSDAARQTIHDEANRLDGCIVVKDGYLSKIQIDEHTNVMRDQSSLMQYAEQEIQEVSGINREMMGYNTNVTSNIGLENKQAQSATMTSVLFENKRHSYRRLGQLVTAQIQGRWTGEKVLRITDRLTGADKFVELNKRIRDEKTGEIVVKNNITQGKYDFIISEAPATDTVREQNLNLVIEWVKKSPPEIIPHLMNLAFEMSNLPNKDVLLARIQPLLGIQPDEQDMSPEEIKQKVMQNLEAEQAEAQKRAQVEQEQLGMAMEKMKLENEQILAQNKKLIAEFEKIMAGIQQQGRKLDIDENKAHAAAFKTGAEVQLKKEQSQPTQLVGFTPPPEPQAPIPPQVTNYEGME